MTEYKKAPLSEPGSEKGTDTPQPHDTEAEAIAAKRVKIASIAGYVSAALTLLFGLFGVFVNSDDPSLAYYLDPWIILDAFLILVLAFYVGRKSFPAAVFLLVYFIIAKILAIYETGNPSGILLSVLFIYLFYGGVLGARYFRKFQVKRKHQIWTFMRWSIGAVVALLLVLGVTMTIMQQAGMMPAYEVVAGGNLPEQQRQALVDNGILEEDEEIELFYSAGLLNLLEDGNLITNRRIVSYWQNNGELEMASAEFAEIMNVVWTSEGNALEDSVLTVNMKDEDYFQLFVTTENAGDEQFVRRIRKKIVAAQQSRPAAL